MGWPILKHTKAEVDRAGEVLAMGVASPADLDRSLDLLDNWRAAHSFALNTIKMGLRQKARKVDTHALTAQRMKRIPSIIEKLRRFPGMRLSQMQDIGGCRAVVDSVRKVRELRSQYQMSRQKHELANHKDYIAYPKESGYRGIHLVYRYKSDRARTHTHNGRLIEIQIRTRLQHAWATAVETVGVFINQALKSSEGSEDWLRFFAVTGSAFALMENTTPVPGAPGSDSELRKEIRELIKQLRVRENLAAYGQAISSVDHQVMRKAYYFVLHLEPTAPRLTVYGYDRKGLAHATAHYLKIEKGLSASPGSQAVLVAADSMKALKRAYPNYFLDTQVFMRSLSEFLSLKSVIQRTFALRG